MRIVVTGASGLVGSTLVRRTGAAGLTHRDLDITHEDAIGDVMTRLRPDLLINCAVVGVDECESNPALAEAVNVTGPAIERWADRVADEHGFTEVNHTVELFGVCRNCAR